MHLPLSTNTDGGPSEQVRHIVLDSAHIAHAPIGELCKKLEPAAGVPILYLHRTLLEPIFQLSRPEHFAADRTVKHFAERGGQFRAGHGFGAEIIVLRTMAFRAVAQDLGGNGGQIVKRDITHAVLAPERRERSADGLRYAEHVFEKHVGMQVRPGDPAGLNVGSNQGKPTVFGGRRHLYPPRSGKAPSPKLAVQEDPHELRTGIFNPEEAKYANGALADLPYPTNDGLLKTVAAIAAVNRLSRPGFK